MIERRMLERQIADLDALDLNGLRAVWRAHYGPPPKLRSTELLRSSLAWRLQAKRHGGLDTQIKRHLRRRGPTQAKGMELGLGTRLRRQWKGQVVEVTVEAEGFRWNGRLYPSLSAAATAIAGTRWNGPRFFGLRDPSR